MKQQLSPRRIVLLGLAVALLVAATLGSHARPLVVGRWIQSPVNDCGSGLICVKWDDTFGLPAGEQCCIPSANLLDDNPSACVVGLRHDLH